MHFHYLVRGIIFVEGKVLLVRQKGADHTFLPGGHIDRGERAESALTREIEEELGKEALVKHFVGAVEHMWVERGREQHEINLIFEVEVPGLETGFNPESLEAHLEFVWSDPRDLESLNLQPYPLIECLMNYGSGYEGYWATSITE
jgi:8-oxo-dGTP pyrophosphatase MutT (NUDIX family)